MSYSYNDESASSHASRMSISVNDRPAMANAVLVTVRQKRENVDFSIALDC